MAERHDLVEKRVDVAGVKPLPQFANGRGGVTESCSQRYNLFRFRGMGEQFDIHSIRECTSIGTNAPAGVWYPARERKKGISPCDKTPFPLWCREVLNLSVASFESFDTSGSIDELLFTGKKRMTGRADLGVDLLACGTGLEHVATQALHSGIRIHRVDTFFHLFLLHIGAANVQFIY